MTATMTNGRAGRKSLADQIERLDSMLDGLSDALNESVADAVKGVVADVVRQAVETAVREVLSNRTVVEAASVQHGLITPTPVNTPTPVAEPVPEQPAQETTWGWACRKASEGWSWACQKGGAGWSWLVGSCWALGQVVWAVLLVLWQFRRTVLLTGSGGLVAGVVSFLAGPVLSAIFCGLGAVLLTLAGLILVPIWQLLMIKVPQST